MTSSTNIELSKKSIEEILSALKSCSRGGYTDIDGDFVNTYSFNVHKVTAEIKKLEQILLDQAMYEAKCKIDSIGRPSIVYDHPCLT